MPIIIDTTVVIACVVNEPHREALLAATTDQELIAPQSLPWEVGNALSAMFKRRRIGLEDALRAIDLFRRMPVELRVVDLESAVRLSNQLHIYAYDAYVIQSAVESRGEILTLDAGLAAAARAAKVPVREIKP
ncbi:MAG: type II toxin-antitoxin system VapC family toxin [Tepidisphaeraceae bacterium]